MLDDDNRELSKIAQKEPAAFGRIKQKALDLGMSTTEYILSHDPERAKQAAPALPNAEQELFKSLAAEVVSIGKEIRTMRQDLTARPVSSPSPQEQNPFGQLSGLLGALSALQNYNNSVVDGYKKTLEDAAGLLPDEIGEPEDPIGSIFSEIARKAISGGSVTPSQIPPAIPAKTTGGQPMDPISIAKGTPQHYKDAIKAGQISLDQAKKMARDGGATFSDAEIEGAYKLIKEGKA